VLDVKALFEENAEALKLSFLTGQIGAGRKIASQSNESADLIGHLNLIHPNRIQVMGSPEVAYYNRLDPQRKSYLTAELLAGKPPAIIIADDEIPPAELFSACEREGLALLRTPVSAAQIIEIARAQLSRILAPQTQMHGVFMDVLGMGVLISGESGLGKSELALELITRGHGLIADDVVDFTRVAPDAVEGRCPPLLQNLLEVRGLGLLDIRTIFGETSVRRKMRLKLIVQMIRRSVMDEFERLPLEAMSQEIMDARQSEQFRLQGGWPERFWPLAMKIVLVTGMSGSGKSVALNVLEDSGYFCIDNLPVAFLVGAVENLESEHHQQLAVAVDARTAGSLAHLSESLDHLREAGHELKVLFLNARNDTLMQRYSETRRRHPLGRTPDTNEVAEEGSVQTLADCIEREREILAEIEPLGIPLDTSDLQPQVLRRWVKELLDLENSRLTVLFQSFAFKDGIPLDADLVFDARCLPNPYYIAELKGLNGRDDAVIRFLESHADVGEMIDDIAAYLTKWLPRHAEENRSYLTVAIGCTGGQHRSVYCSERLQTIFMKKYSCAVRHRSLSQKGKA